MSKYSQRTLKAELHLGCGRRALTFNLIQQQALLTLNIENTSNPESLVAEPDFVGTKVIVCAVKSIVAQDLMQGRNNLICHEKYFEVLIKDNNQITLKAMDEIEKEYYKLQHLISGRSFMEQLNHDIFRSLFNIPREVNIADIIPENYEHLLPMLSLNLPVLSNKHKFGNYVSLASYNWTADALARPSRICAVDCEMVMCKGGSELASVGIVDTEGKVWLDNVVKTQTEVREWLTQYSGMRPGDIKADSLTLRDVQMKMRELIAPGDQVVYHSNQNDTQVLFVYHVHTIDTQVLLSRCIFQLEVLNPSLQACSLALCDLVIQHDHRGHSAAIDAKATALLYKKIATYPPGYFRYSNGFRLSSWRTTWGYQPVEESIFDNKKTLKRYLQSNSHKHTVLTLETEDQPIVEEEVEQPVSVSELATPALDEDEENVDPNVGNGSTVEEDSPVEPVEKKARVELGPSTSTEEIDPITSAEDVADQMPGSSTDVHSTPTPVIDIPEEWRPTSLLKTINDAGKTVSVLTTSQSGYDYVESVVPGVCQMSAENTWTTSFENIVSIHQPDFLLCFADTISTEVAAVSQLMDNILEKAEKGTILLWIVSGMKQSPNELVAPVHTINAMTIHVKK